MLHGYITMSRTLEFRQWRSSGTTDSRWTQISLKTSGTTIMSLCRQEMPWGRQDCARLPRRPPPRRTAGFECFYSLSCATWSLCSRSPLAQDGFVSLGPGSRRPPRDPWQCGHACIKAPTQRGDLREYAGYGRSVLRRHTLLGASRSQPARGCTNRR
jgi:hypothetical protein